jgi:hypothetical protein
VSDTNTNELVSSAVRNEPVSDTNTNELVSIDELINPKSVICCDDEIVPLGILPPLPNPLAAAEAEIKVGSMKDAVATDIDEVSDTNTNELVSSEVKNDPVSNAVRNDPVSSDVINELVSSAVKNDPVCDTNTNKLVSTDELTNPKSVIC